MYARDGSGEGQFLGGNVHAWAVVIPRVIYEVPLDVANIPNGVPIYQASRKKVEEDIYKGFWSNVSNQNCCIYTLLRF
jgi:hypothetical protein